MDDLTRSTITNALGLIALMATSDLEEEHVALEEKLQAIEGQIRVIRECVNSEDMPTWPL